MWPLPRFWAISFLDTSGFCLSVRWSSTFRRLWTWQRWIADSPAYFFTAAPYAPFTGQSLNNGRLRHRGSGQGEHNWDRRKMPSL